MGKSGSAFQSGWWLMKRRQLTNIIGDVDIKSFEGAKEESFESGVVLALSLQGVVFGSHNDVLHNLQVLNKLLPEELLTRCKMLGVREARLDLSRGGTKEVRHQAWNHLRKEGDKNPKEERARAGQVFKTILSKACMRHLTHHSA